MPRLLRSVVIALTAVATVLLPAAPATARPGRVGPPYVIGSTPHSLTVTWPAKAGARHYQVRIARSPAKARRLSATMRRPHGRHTSLRLRHLQPNTKYCFTVRAVRRGSAGPSSAAMCHLTMSHPIRRANARISVATFNVCAIAPQCRPWAGREDAIVRRILDADADVVAVQEVTRRTDDLARRLGRHGYALYTRNGRGLDEAIYYRRSKLSVGVPTAAANACDPAATTTCTTPAPEAEWHGELDAGMGATAAWAALRLLSNGRTYVFVSAHLTHADTPFFAGLRHLETKRLIRSAKHVAGPWPIVFMGDFNSYRGLARDTPREEMAKKGWFDAYDRSASYSRPYTDSYNGYRPRIRTLPFWGGHIDRIFIRSSMGSSAWRVVAHTERGRYVGTKASDHNPVRATLYLP